ncbi:hypothetical protein [Mesorhizobium sp. M6A.T.Ce.TU.016.01.1.1]|uniref:hypothetical protein n=1 Tax=Mesorhizobium sp. M6A.T.Ce.TU.016.01.1.1 TaxID=2496783 RepID=UPI000FCADDDB|nr:hypothetical protein [Mesorhizobium sp. M6A.T.Ce.TU.016.01.1.1]RUU29727.1 hypothetical protein EOC94_12715 [Mesorhizobium sp. M6A.T.Ce.TU.016.01.1.1]
MSGAPDRSEFRGRLVPRFPTAQASQADHRCAEPAAPADHSSTAGAVALSEASAFILSLVAAHEGRPERDIVAALIASAGEAIGLSPLLARGAQDIGDLADLPGFARKAANRFRGGP